MGVLVAKAYPTMLVLGAADHTYVECGTGGRAWGCFGGKSGGHELSRGVGSTNQADAIAGPDEHSGLRCYALNGVCHQAANRILIAAGITVEGARGYGVSQALYGTYGRTGILRCRSPFDKHLDVTGDLEVCLTGDAERQVQDSEPLSTERQADAAFAREALAIYDRHADLFQRDDADIREVEAFHMDVFAHMLDFKAGPILDSTTRAEVMNRRAAIEQDFVVGIEQPHADGQLDGPELGGAVDALAVDMQRQFAEIMTDAQYQSLLGLTKDDVIGVVEPDILPGSPEPA